MKDERVEMVAEKLHDTHLSGGGFENCPYGNLHEIGKNRWREDARELLTRLDKLDDGALDEIRELADDLYDCVPTGKNKEGYANSAKASERHDKIITLCTPTPEPDTKPCPNCDETVEQCACMRNICVKCGKPVGNITFSFCDACWDKSHCTKPDTPDAGVLDEIRELAGVKNKASTYLNIPPLPKDADSKFVGVYCEMKDLLKKSFKRSCAIVRLCTPSPAPTLRDEIENILREEQHTPGTSEDYFTDATDRIVAIVKEYEYDE